MPKTVQVKALPPSKKVR
jgi:hypothetical protein